MNNARDLVVRHFRQICVWPLQLMPLRPGQQVQRHWEALESIKSNNHWREVVEKFANQHKVDVAYGTLFSHVVVGSAPTAGELKLPYYVVSEGYHVASGKLNRYCFQPGIADVRAQTRAVGPFIANNVGKKVTMLYPDYAFGFDHRDYFPPNFEASGGKVVAMVPIPPTETSGSAPPVAVRKSASRRRDSSASGAPDSPPVSPAFAERSAGREIVVLATISAST